MTIRRSITPIVLVFASIIVGVGQMRDVCAATISLTATQDASISTNFKSNNYNTLEVTDYSTNYEALLQFDLSQIPAGSTINGAYLRLFLVGPSSASAADSNATPFVIQAFENSDTNGTITFDGSTVTYNDVLAATPMGSNQSSTSLGDYSPMPWTLNSYLDSVSADAADIAKLQGIHDAGGSLILELYASVSGNHSRVFEDLENTHGTGNFAKLVVDYTPIPEPSALILATFGLAFVGIFRSHRKL